jgi:hypothetical protein
MTASSQQAAAIRMHSCTDFIQGEHIERCLRREFGFADTCIHSHRMTKASERRTGSKTNGTARELIGGSGPSPDADGTAPPLLRKYLFSALGGTAWHFQFFFYTTGESLMGRLQATHQAHRLPGREGRRMRCRLTAKRF